MRKRKRENLEDALWAMDQKTAALMRIHRICNECVDDGDIDLTDIKKIRQIASDIWPLLAYTEADRNLILPRTAKQ